MFAAIALALCAIEIVTAHLMDLSPSEYTPIFQAYIVVLCFGAIVSDGSQRDRSVLTVLLLWGLWNISTDHLGLNLPTYLMSLESALFTSFVLWALARPYFYPSDERRELNVCIAFYKGGHAPFLSSLGALVGLPFASVAIVTGNTALRASGGGKMVLSPANALLAGDDFVVIDTGIPATAEIMQAIAKCVGKPTKTFGVFRAKCVANLGPILNLIGYEPKNFFYKIPSIFYFQCVRKAHG